MRKLMSAATGDRHGGRVGPRRRGKVRRGNDRRGNVRRGRADRGYMTVLVLTVAGLLAALVAATLHVARPSLGQAVFNMDDLQADGLIEGGVAAAGYALFATKKPPKNLDGAILPFETGAVRLSVKREAGRVDLNGARPDLLQQVYASLGARGLTPEIFAARVADWRDRNDKPQRSGAEENEYRGSGLNYGPRNGPFQSVSELGFVFGVTDEDLALLTPHLTVYNPEGLIDPASAEEAVMMAIPNMTGGQASALAEAFSNPETPKGELKELIRPFRKYVTSEPEDVYRITVEARLVNGFAKSVEAVVMSGRNKSAYRVLYWRVVPAPIAAAPGSAVPGPS